LLLFLKLADERQRRFSNRTALIPRALDWQSLERLDGDDLDTHYRHTLVELRMSGNTGTVSADAPRTMRDAQE
jgi:type I restriction enzyme M protein